MCNHPSYTSLSAKVIGCPASGPTLDLFYPVNQFVRVGVPNGRGVFKLWPEKGIVSSLAYSWYFCLVVAANKSKGPVYIACNAVNMEVPGEITVDINSQIFGTGDKIQGLSMQYIVSFNCLLDLEPVTCTT